MRPDFQTAEASHLGTVYISDTEAHVGPFCRLYALAATVVASAESNIAGNEFAAVPIPAGGAIDGIFTSVTLTSGKIVAYKA